MAEQSVYRVWLIGNEPETGAEILATSHLKAREQYAAEIGESVSNLDSREIVPAN